MNKNITISWDGSQSQEIVADGTTAASLMHNATLMRRLGIPATAQPMVNGQISNMPLRDGDHVTFQSAPTQKA